MYPETMMRQFRVTENVSTASASICRNDQTTEARLAREYAIHEQQAHQLVKREWTSNSS